MNLKYAGPLKCGLFFPINTIILLHDLRLVEFIDTEPTDTESRLYFLIFFFSFFNGSIVDVDFR